MTARHEDWESILKALRRSEQQFRLFLTASSDMVYSMSFDWKEMYTLEGKNVLDDTKDPTNDWIAKYIPETDRDLVWQTIREAISGKTVFELEHRVNRKDGTIGWITSRAIPLLDEKGAIIEWLGAGNDITQRKRAEEDALEREQNYRSMIEHMNQGFCIIQLKFDETGSPVDYLFLVTNPVFEQQTGLIDAQGKWMRQLEPKHEQHWFDLYGQVVKSREPLHFEQHAAHLAGGVWYDVYAFPFGDSESSRVTLLFNDITERKRSEIHQNFMLRLSDRLRSAASTVETQAVTCQLLGEELNVDRAYFGEINEAGGWVRVREHFGRSDSPSMAGTYRIVDYGWSLPIMRRGETIILNDVQHAAIVPESFRPALLQIQIVAHIAVPIIRHHVLVGILCITEPQARVWTTAEIALMHEVADRLWEAFERARAEEAVQRSEEKYRTLFNSIDQGFNVIELIFNEEGKVTDYWQREHNPVFTRLTGIENAIGKKMSELVPYVEPAWHEMIEQIYYTGEPLQVEYPVEALGKWFKAYMSRVGGPGSPLVACVYDDITEQKQLEQRQEFLLGFSDTLRAERGVKETGDVACHMIAKQLGADRVYLVTLNQNNDEVTVTNETSSEDLPPMLGLYHSSDFPSAIKEIFEHTIVYDDIRTDPRLTELERVSFTGLGAVGFIATSIRRGNETMIWAAGALNRESRKWTRAEITLFEDAVERTWAAIERARSEEVIARSEKRLLSIANLVPDLLWDSEPDVSTNWYNQRWLEYTGQRFVEAIGWGWVDAIHPDDRKNSMKLYTEAVEAGQPLQLEERIRRHDGVYRWFVVNASPVFDEHGKVVKMYGAATDIHDRKQAEEILRKSEAKYRTLFESIDEGFALMELHRDHNGAVVDLIYREVNEAFKRFTGWQDAVGRQGSSLMPHLESSLLNQMQWVADTGKPFRKEDYVADLDRWFDVHYSCVEDPGKNFIIAVFKDTTERKKREQNQDFLLSLSDTLRTIPDVETIQMTSLKMLSAFLSLDRAYIAQVHRQQDLALIGPEFRRDELDLVPISGQLHMTDFPEGFRKVEEQTLIVENVTSDPTLSELDKRSLSGIDLIALVVASVRKGDVNVIWSLVASTITPRKWDQHEIELIENVAERTWAAVERAKTEAALQQRERELARVQEIGNIGGVDIDVANGLNGIRSPEYIRLHGLAADTRSETYQDWLNRLHPDDREAAEKTLFSVLKSTLPTYESEYRIIRPDNGQVRWIYAKMDIERNLSGGVSRLIGVHIDITPRKQAEEALRHAEEEYRSRLEKEVIDRTRDLQESRDQLKSLLDTTLIQMSILQAVRDDDGGIIDFKIKMVNRELEKVSKRRDLVGKLYAQEFPGIKKTGLFDLIVKTIATGKPQSIEYFYPHEGFNKWFICMFVRLADGVVATNMDISDRKFTEEKLRKLEADKQREIFEVSLKALEEERHRISESLHNGIAQLLYGAKISMAGFLQDTSPAAFAENKKYVSKILTDAIIEARRISHELMPTTLEEFGLKSAIDDICLQLSDGTKFNCQIIGQYRPMEKYMELAVYRTAQELMTNVIKHANATHCDVKVNIGHRMIDILVSDNGNGMELSGDSKPGIGLASIRSKIKLLNGEVRIESSPGTGTAVHIVIPQPQNEQLK